MLNTTILDIWIPDKISNIKPLKFYDRSKNKYYKFYYDPSFNTSDNKLKLNNSRKNLSKNREERERKLNRRKKSQRLFEESIMRLEKKKKIIKNHESNYRYRILDKEEF